MQHLDDVEVLMLMVHSPFSPRMQLDRQQAMWEVWQSGKEMSEAAAEVGVDRKTVYNRIAEAGGIRPRRRQTRSRLSYEDRVHIEIGLEQDRSKRAIAADLGRHPSTISREVKNHADSRGGYAAKRAHAMAFEDARRPQASKIESNPALKARLLADLGKKHSPEEIAGRLRRDFPDDPEMTVHHETIYRFIYLQPRGELKRQVAAALRSGRAMRRPQTHGRATGQGQIPGMVSIHDRPPVDHPDGTRIPGHWEGDLIVGKNNGSAIGTVVERATGYLMLLHLPQGRGVEQVTAALTQRLVELPDSLRQSLTWDQGKELSQHARVSVDAGIDIYFADPHTPWHRPSNENTNGLLRQYFPKGTDLSVHSVEHLLFVEQEMNDRPRKRLDYAKPQELMTQLVLDV
jgi:transposase, IS30 family